MQGWVCPTCGEVNAPWARTCASRHATTPTSYATTTSCNCDNGKSPKTFPCPVHGGVG